jgi:PKD repeat protein
MSPKSSPRSPVPSGPLTILALSLLAAALPRPASARIINVPANQPTLQAAVAAAATGDTVLFAPGTYTGGIWMPDKGIVFGSRFLTTGDTTYIAQTVLTGLVSNICGGAAACTGDAIFEMGPHAAPSAIIGLTMTNAVKGVRTSCRTDVDHCHAVGMILAGDGVNYLPGSSGTISNSVFANNRDDGIDLNGDVSVTVVNNIVMGNSDDGIEFRMYPYSGPTLTTTVTGNRFIDNGSDGIQLIDSPDSSHREVRIERNLFSGNQKATIGCMGDQQTQEDYSGSPLAEHVVFANNTCVGNFYGICGGANSVVVNNIFEGTTNSALRRIGGNSICAYNLLWNNGLNYESSNLDLPHTLTADPRLDANFKLTTGSPAINAGVAFFQWRGQTILNLPSTAYSGSAPDLGVYEFGGTSPANAAPVVSAGSAQTITLPADAVLDGTVSDDGLPNPPGALTTTWNVASGPAAVTFLNAAAVDTRATFAVAGTYVLRLTASDGALSTSATVQVIVQPPATSTTYERRVAAGIDDAEESSTGTLNLTSPDLELVHDGSDQSVGMRFASLAIPRGTVITRAYLQFEAKEAQSEVTSLTIRGQAADNPATFSTSSNVSTRVRTIASASWAPVAWGVLNEIGANQRTPDLSPVVQEIVNRPGWTSGNAMVILINGTGHRTAWSYDGLPAGAPLLHIETGPPPTNTAPVVSAGPAQTITLPAEAALDGTVSDDGLPNPPGALTTTWSLVSGPAAVTFLNANAVDTRATFTVAGTYSLRLTASDGALSTSATVQITVQPGPVTSATIERRIAAATDDAEESTNATSSLQLSSFDIELVFDIDTNQWVGLRFTNLTIPRGAFISRAYLQFEADEAQSEATNLLIQGQAADNPGTFSFTDKVASRPRTTAAATWAPAPWTLVGEAGLNQRSADFSAVVQEIVNRPGWASGNAMVLVVNGTGHRTARAFDAMPANAALLHIETGSPPPPPPPANAAPVVDAGPAQTITLPADAALDGTVSDDGQPSIPGACTTTWSMISGPAPVAFQNAGAVDTRATFTMAGTYLLSLSADDGALSVADSVEITVAAPPPPPNDAPVVSAGPDQTITLPATAALDGTVSDDALPNPPGVLTTVWSLISGPAPVAFQNAGAVDTRATFTTAGTYRLSLSANDGALSVADSVEITVEPGPPPPPPTNTAPVVDAGPARAITLPADAALDGTVSDDGLPNPPGALTTTWSLISGPAPATFQNAGAVDTRVAFTVAGTYWLRLAADDGELAVSDSVAITVAPPPPPPPPNAAPVVSAGPAQTITLPADAFLDGTVSDDGLPNPPGALTTTWSLASGPAAVAFENPGGTYTRATFTTAGTYSLRLTASDGALSRSATVQITVQPAPVITTTVERRVAAGTDDAEESSATASLQLSSSDIELVFDIDNNQWVGLRFTNVAIPRGATISRAYLQFEADEVQSEATNLVIRGQAADNPGTFSFTDKVASRPRTAASATWTPAPWTLVGEAGANQRSVDLSAVVQEIVNRPGWASGNAMVMVVSGTGHCTARAFESVPAGAALLHIEAGTTPPPPTNAAPVVDAGLAQTVTLPSDAILDGTVSDDGLPTPPGALTTTWSLASGPAAVTFQNASAVDTRATFTVAGTYSLRLTASDGALSTSATVQITVQTAAATTTFERRVAASSDDAEESATGTLVLTSSDLELVFDGSNQWVGLRFTNVTIPRGAPVTRAYLQFEAKEAQSEVTSLTIRGQAADNPVTFSTSSTVSTRSRTTASATWAPAAWGVLNEAGANQRTPDLSPVVQEIVNRPGWASGNAMVILINGTGHRTAWSFEGVPTGAPLLHIESGTTPPPPPLTNTAPVVSAGLAQTITLPADALLDGTVTDDGLPTPPGALTTTWSLASGPAAVTFQNASAVDTRATFTVAGTYSLRLTASDGALSSSATVQITVQPAPVTTATIERRIAASTDDAEESTAGTLLLTSSDLELVNDGVDQLVGMRFTNLTVPTGATITRAYIQFQAAGLQSGTTTVLIQAEAVDNAVTFSTTRKVSVRPRTTASASWVTVAWGVLNEAGANQRTPDLSAVVQQIVSRAGWASGNAAVFLITGTGHRTAWAYEGKPAGAPLLHIEYTGPGPAPAQGARAAIAAEPAAAPVAAPRYEFALHRLSPNPSRGQLHLEFTLADGQPVALQVLDLMGRRVAERDLGSPGPGRHVFELRQPLPPGLYAVRLVQGSQARIMKAVVVK